MTDKEICEMLKSKMVKNGIQSDCYKSVTNLGYINENSVKITHLYSEDMLIKAIGLAYTVGYKRAEKGRPFKYGDKARPKSDKFVTDKNGNKIYYSNERVKVGDKVVFVGHPASLFSPWPEHGTMGEVIECARYEELWVLWEGEDKEHHNWRSYCKKVVD